MLITEILARNARMYANEVALIEREPEKNRRSEITWAQFHEAANAVAKALIARKVRKGDRVILLMINCLEWLPIYFGILRTGAWAVPLNFRFTAEDIRTCAEIVQAKVVFFRRRVRGAHHADQERPKSLDQALCFRRYDKAPS